MNSREWCSDWSEVTRLGRWLVEQDRIDDLKELNYFYEKPWKWANERAVMLGEKFVCGDCEAISDFSADPDIQPKDKRGHHICADCYDGHRHDAIMLAGADEP